MASEIRRTKRGSRSSTATCKGGPEGALAAGPREVDGWELWFLESELALTRLDGARVALAWAGGSIGWLMGSFYIYGTINITNPIGFMTYRG
jgi:hypothetical protein